MERPEEFEPFIFIDKRKGKVKKYQIPISPKEIRRYAESTREEIKQVPCPYKLDKSGIAESLMKIFNKTKLTFGINLEITLTSTPLSHFHTILVNPDTNKIISENDQNESASCGLFLDIKEEVKTKLLDKEVVDNSKKEFEELSKNELFRVEKEELADYQNTFSSLNEYLELNLLKELNGLTQRMIFEFYTLNSPTELRETYIKHILKVEEKNLRNRLPSVKGRVAIKEKSDFQPERNKFVNKCAKLLNELNSKKIKLNKNQLAKRLFRSDNPLLLLNRKLKDFDLTFDQIMEVYNSQNLPYLERKIILEKILSR